MDSFRGAKPAQDKTPKTKLTNSGATLYFFVVGSSRVPFYTKIRLRRCPRGPNETSKHFWARKPAQ